MNKTMLVSKNKVIEVQADYWENWWNYFNIDIVWSRNCDHAGFSFTLEVMGYMFAFSLYDIHHWNEDKNKPQEYDEKTGEYL